MWNKDFCKKWLFYCRWCNRKNNNSIDGLMSKEKNHFFLNSPSNNIHMKLRTMYVWKTCLDFITSKPTLASLEICNLNLEARFCCISLIWILKIAIWQMDKCVGGLTQTMLVSIYNQIWSESSPYFSSDCAFLTSLCFSISARRSCLRCWWWLRLTRLCSLIGMEIEWSLAVARPSQHPSYSSRCPCSKIKLVLVTHSSLTILKLLKWAVHSFSPLVLNGNR